MSYDKNGTRAKKNHGNPARSRGQVFDPTSKKETDHGVGSADHFSLAIF